MGIFLISDEYNAQQETHPSIQISPTTKFKELKLRIFPLMIIFMKPIKEIIIPINWRKEIFELKIKKDKTIIIEGANAGIKDELITEEVVRAIFIEVLNIETLRIEKKIIIFQFFLKIEYMILIFWNTNGSNKNIEIAKSCEDRLMSAFNG